MKEYVRYDLQLKHQLVTTTKVLHSNLQHLQNELNSTRGGKLYIKQCNGRFFYTEYANKTEKGIGRNKARIHKLARRNYIHDLTRILKRYCAILEEVSQQLNFDKDIELITAKLNQYENLSLNTNQILYSHEQLKWLTQSYVRNPAYPEELKFATNNNIPMRSKSEVMIANKLEDYYIPYLPEFPLWFPYDMHPKYPDFTILAPNGHIILWEHFGRMDDESYFIKNCRKLREYQFNGYSQHTNLIVTWENDIETPNLIDNIIHTRILR